jgi:predicted RNase H-like HicB family nuclease
MSVRTLGLRVELEREADSGRWIAAVRDLPGVMVCAPTRAKALRKAQALPLEVLADRLAHGEKLLTGRTPAPRLA